jgi:hypothetical protein
MFEPQTVIPGPGNPPDDFQTVSQVNKEHGRIEERRLTVSSLLKDYSSALDQQERQRLACVKNNHDSMIKGYMWICCMTWPVYIDFIIFYAIV